jgi:hypothetical protein
MASSIGDAQMGLAEDLNNVQVAAPIDTDSAGRAGDIATHSVVRLICQAQNSMGTGFLHKSGNCPSSDDLRLVRRFAKGGSGSSGVRV